MWHRLALAWSCTKTDAKKRCTLPEFLDWQAWYEINPFGEERDDLRAALIAWAVATFTPMGRKSGARKPRLEDFLLRFGKGRRRAMSADEVMAVMKSFAGAHNRGK